MNKFKSNQSVNQSQLDSRKTDVSINSDTVKKLTNKTASFSLKNDNCKGNSNSFINKNSTSTSTISKSSPVGLPRSKSSNFEPFNKIQKNNTLRRYNSSDSSISNLSTLKEVDFDMDDDYLFGLIEEPELNVGINKPSLPTTSNTNNNTKNNNSIQIHPIENKNSYQFKSGINGNNNNGKVVNTNNNNSNIKYSNFMERAKAALHSKSELENKASSNSIQNQNCSVNKTSNNIKNSFTSSSSSSSSCNSTFNSTNSSGEFFYVMLFLTSVRCLSFYFCCVQLALIASLLIDKSHGRTFIDS